MSFFCTISIGFFICFSWKCAFRLKSFIELFRLRCEVVSNCRMCVFRWRWHRYLLSHANPTCFFYKYVIVSWKTNNTKFDLVLSFMHCRFQYNSFHTSKSLFFNLGGLRFSQSAFRFPPVRDIIEHIHTHTHIYIYIYIYIYIWQCLFWCIRIRI